MGVFEEFIRGAVEDCVKGRSGDNPVCPTHGMPKLSGLRVGDYHCRACEAARSRRRWDDDPEYRARSNARRRR